MPAKHLSTALFILLCTGGALAGESAKVAMEEDDEEDATTFGEVSIAYDGSNYRTSKWSLTASLEHEFADDWSAEIGVRTFNDLHHGSLFRTETQGYLFLHKSLWKSKDEDLFLSAGLSAAGPSLITYQGFEFTPELVFDGEVMENLWAGIAIGGTLTTAPNEGDNVGTMFASAWLTYDTEWLKNESDYVTVDFYFYTDETPGYGNSFSIEGAYGFDLTDSLSVEFGIGTEITTPYDRHAVYATGRFTWSW